MKTRLAYLGIFIVALILRGYQIDSVPHGFNADEAAIGYNAWSLLETGRDEHGARWPLVFRSFDDYKPPLYFYLTLPFVFILGLGEVSVRLPSIILGSLSVIVLGMLVDRLIKVSKPGVWVALSLAIMPWHIVFSRGGWEVNAATSLLIVGLWIMSQWRSNRGLLFGGVVMILSMYTYHSARIYVPIIGFFFVWIFQREHLSIKKWRSLVWPIVIWAAVLSPLAIQMFSKEGQSRFAGVSVFFDQGPLWEALEMRREHSTQNLGVRLLHSRYVTYGIRFVENYLSHYSVDFLVFKGDVIDRSKVPGVGQIYLLMLPIIVVGMLWSWRRHKKLFVFVAILLLVAPLASSLTYQSPHALRSQVMSIPLAVFCGLGLYRTRLIKGYGGVVLGMMVVVMIWSVGRFWHYYQTHYPTDYPTAWQYGFSRIGEYLRENGGRYDLVVISTRYDQPYILTAFYLNYPPARLQEELVMSERDQFGFSTGQQFGKYRFKKIEALDFDTPKTLIVVADEGVEGGRKVEEIGIGGKVIFRLYETE